MHVLVLHNRYRQRGGEERLVEQQVELLRARNHTVGLLEIDSGKVEQRRSGRVAAGLSLLGGGSASNTVVETVASGKYEIVHAHNVLPMFGWRSLAAAKRQGAKVVLHLHNYRLYCSVGTFFRDGERCYECASGRGRVPAIVHNCRGSRAESATYALALTTQYRHLTKLVDRFVVPSSSAAVLLAESGLPADKIRVLPNFAANSALVATSTADAGEFALYVGRLGEEKGALLAAEAAVRAGVPLKVAGDGPQAAQLAALADRGGGLVEPLGVLSQAQLAQLRAQAAFAVMPSLSDEVSPFAALEATGSGLPLLASRVGGLPEIVGREEMLFTPGDVAELADRAARLWGDPPLRKQLGDAALARTRELFSETAFLTGIEDLYREVTAVA